MPKLVRSGLLCAAIGITLAATATGATAATQSTPTTRTGQSSQVTLITGDTVTVDGSTLTVDQQGIDGYHGYRDATGDAHVIPAIAQPYLGHLLDPALFDVSALVRDGLATSGRIPVALTYAAGSTPAAPDGITLTSTTGTTASGYLTPASANAFAAALRRAIGADIAAGRPAGTTAPQPGLTGISLAAAGSTNVVSPYYALYPLHINETDNTGAPANEYLTLINTDAVGKQQSEVPIADGIGQVEVPAGHYSAIADFVDFDASGTPTAIRQLTVPDFTVAAASTPTSLSVAESSATTPVTVTTPETTTRLVMAVYSARGDANGGSASDFVASRTLPIYVAPTAAPQVGTAHFVVGYSASTADAQYDLAFAADHGIPANESYVVNTRDLATAHQRLSADPAVTGDAVVFTGLVDPRLNIVAGSIGHHTVPGVLTHYFGAADGGHWQQTVAEPNYSSWQDADMGFAAGRSYSQDWGHGPLAIDFGTGYTGRRGCYACVSNGYLLTQPNWGSDNSPGHTGNTGNLLINNTSITAYRDGVQLPTNPEDAFFGLADIPQTPSIYRLVFDHAAAADDGFSQSLSLHTDVTFHYTPTTDPGQELPAGDICNAGPNGQPAYGTACQILPMLSIGYQLQPSDLTNTSTAPIQRLGLTIGHLSYDGHGSHSTIASAALAISLDSGKTWQPVPLLGACGNYFASWPNPQAGPGPELKVTAADADGNTITETVSPAYTIGSTQ